MSLRFTLWLFALALIAATGAHGQISVRTERIRPPAAAPAPAAQLPPAGRTAEAPAKPPAHAVRGIAIPEIIRDLSRLPPAVARTREQILAAASSGELQKLVDLMRASTTPPVFTFTNEVDPIAYWQANYPDSKGVEVLSILVTILETGFVHVDQGTPQEMYVWPYFVRMPLKELSAAQQVELFKILTGADYKDLLEFGAYAFFRLGIGPDGSWQFFVTGD
jgi:hypothetical protein